MPNVHFAVPGSRQLWASSAACWSTISPADRDVVRRKTSVVPTISSQPTIVGQRLAGEPEQLEQLGVPRRRCQSSSSDLLAVEASVTNAPHEPVHQPGVGGGDHTVACRCWRRIHAIFGAEKYGSSTSPVRRGQRPRRGRRARRTSPRRAGPATRSPASAAGRCRGPTPARSRPGWPGRRRRRERRPGPAPGGRRRPPSRTAHRDPARPRRRPVPRTHRHLGESATTRRRRDRRRRPWCLRCPGRWPGCAESSVRDLPHSEVDLPLSGRNVRLTSTAPPSGRTGIRQQCRGAEKRIAPHGIDHAHYRRADRRRSMGNAQFLLSGWADRSRAGAATLQRCLQARRCT